MTQIQELYKQIQCQFSNEIYKKLKEKRFGIATCKNSLTQSEINELWADKDMLKYLLNKKECEVTFCDINKLLQNINHS